MTSSVVAQRLLHDGTPVWDRRPVVQDDDALSHNAAGIDGP